MTTPAVPHKILMAVSDLFERQAAETILRESGFWVEAVTDGPSAIERFARFAPDLLILPCSLQRMDGFTVARTIRQQLDISYTPILMTAPDDEDQVVNQAYESGATAFSVTPLNWTIEVHRIRYLIRNARIQRQLHRRVVELQHTQKQDAIGRLAGGIAHDFNNMLTAMINGSDLALLALDDPEELRIELAEIRKATKRAVSLTRQLLAFSRRLALEPQTLDVNALIGGMEKMLGRMVRNEVRMDLRFSPELPPVKVDPGQLEQVIMNLVVNANDAMPEGGTLTIATTYTSRYREVVITVRDTGHGMSEEVQQQIFEPFFTTKPIGEGTGLGLSTVFGVVKQSGGRIQVESEVGQGTRIHVALPVSSDPLPAPVVGERVAEQTGHEIILLVEDDDSLRDVFAKRLRGYGYTVLEAADGLQAVELAEACRDRVDLLLTDLVLPKLNGRLLARRLRQRDSELRVLYMTGYAEHRLLDAELTAGGDLLLQKPFPLSRLHPTVRRSLDAPAEDRPLS